MKSLISSPTEALAEVKMKSLISSPAEFLKEAKQR
jgi:hypothetical protein